MLPGPFSVACALEMLDDALFNGPVTVVIALERRVDAV